MLVKMNAAEVRLCYLLFVGNNKEIVKGKDTWKNNILKMLLINMLKFSKCECFLLKKEQQKSQNLGMIYILYFKLFLGWLFS